MRVVELEREGPVALVRLNRPEAHNAIDERVMTRLEELLDELDRAREVIALVLTGAGNTSFCAGGDLKHFATLPERAQGLAMSRRMQALLERLEDGPRWTLAAINGRALGGGCELITACHYRLAAAHARFAFRQARNGVVTGWGGGRRLLGMLRPSVALELLVGAREVGAEESAGIGLVDRVVPAERLLDEARRLAGEVARCSPRAVRGFLELAAAERRARLAPLAELETERFGDTWTSPEFARTLAEFVARSRPTPGHPGTC